MDAGWLENFFLFRSKKEIAKKKNWKVFRKRKKSHKQTETETELRKECVCTTIQTQAKTLNEKILNSDSGVLK